MIHSPTHLSLSMKYALIWRFIALLTAVLLLNWAPAAAQEKRILVLFKERDPNHENVVNYLTQFLEKAGYHGTDFFWTG